VLVRDQHDTVSARTFRDVMAAGDAGRGRQHGRRGRPVARRDVGSVVSLSLDPPLVMFAVRNGSTCTTDPRQHALLRQHLARATGDRRTVAGNPAAGSPGHRAVEGIPVVAGRSAGWSAAGPIGRGRGSHRADRPVEHAVRDPHGAGPLVYTSAGTPTRSAGRAARKRQSSLLNLTSRETRSSDVQSGELVIGVLKVVDTSGRQPHAPRSGGRQRRGQQHDIRSRGVSRDRSRHRSAGVRAPSQRTQRIAVPGKGMRVCRREVVGVAVAVASPRPAACGQSRRRRRWPVRGRPFVLASPRAATATTATRSPSTVRASSVSRVCTASAAPSRAAS